VAGIIDGEGTITLTRTHRGENRRPVVSISSTELQLLTYVQSVIGAGRITGKACAREHHSPSFAYCVTSRQALALLAQVYPFLRTYKSKRACLLLEEYQHVTPRNGRLHRGTTRGSCKFGGSLLRYFHARGNYEARCSLALHDDVRRYRAARSAHTNE
jgi:hypothetical protein